MPDAGDAAHLVEYWIAAGMFSSGGMAPAPLSFSDLRSWAIISGLEPSVWELKVVRAMSAAYVAQLHQASDPACPPPFGVVANVDRAAVSKRLGAAFGALTKKGKRNERWNAND